MDKEDKNTVVIHDRTSGNSNVGIINESVPYYMQPQKAKGVTQNEHPMTERKIPPSNRIALTLIQGDWLCTQYYVIQNLILEA